MAASKKTFLITPVNGEPYDVEATSYDFDPQTGRHTFKDGDELVANLINVSVRRSVTK